MGEGRGACAPLKGGGWWEEALSSIVSGEEGSCIIIVDEGAAEGDAMLDSEERLLLEDWKTE